MEITRLGLVPYQEAWDLQRALATDRADDRRSDTLLLLEHPSVYTAGRRTLPEERPFDGTPVIREIERVSKPGRRVYASVKNLPRINNGLGVSILSTPKGVMADHDAREHNVGGEILCTVF